jgi:hypothetical protein
MENHCHALALLFVFYNFAASIRRSGPRSYGSGISDKLLDMSFIVGLIDERDGPPKPRGPYKKQATASVS